MTAAANLGSPAFRARYGLRLAYMAGAMANGIASEALVEAMAAGGLLGSFGAAGLPLDGLEAAVSRLARRVPPDRLCVNLIHAPDVPSLELATAQVLLRLGVGAIEASAYVQPTEAVALFRATGAAAGRPGRVIAKVSRREVATPFLHPAPAAVLQALAGGGLLSPADAAAAASLPLASDLTVEADSGGHTDGQSLVCAFPAVLALRSELAVRFPAAAAVAVGAAGGLGTPAALAAAFAMGADYVVTGSINQACVEAGTSDAAKRMLAASEPGDTAMAPAPDMFELGARVQVLKRGTLYALRAQRLYDLWRDHRSLDALPDETVRQLEAQVFRQPLAALWPQVQAFWSERDPERLRAADRDSSLKLALLFRWYLGLSSRWALGGDATRAADFQIWCGPSMAAFNLWARSTPFERPEGRRVVAVAEALMDGCARLLAEVGSARGQAPAAAPAPVPADDEHPSVRDWLIAAVASALGVPEEDVDPRDPFTSYGMDSVQAMLLLKRLERRIGRPLSPTMVFNYPSIDALSARLSAEAVCG